MHDIYSSEKDLGGLYVEIMHVCQPFYSLPEASTVGPISIPPRLEDGLSRQRPVRGRSSDNPQDPMAARYNNRL